MSRTRWIPQVLALASVAVSLLVIGRERTGLSLVLAQYFVPFVALLWICLVLALAGLWLELRAARRAATASSPWRSAFVALVLAWLGFLACVPQYERLWLVCALGVSGGIFGALRVQACVFALAGAPRSLARGIDLLLFTLAASALGLELGLRALSFVRPSALLATIDASPTRVLERNRAKPGELRFGFPCNALGHYDDEFHVKRPGEKLVACIGDSFSLGTVPHALHYTSVAERTLGVEVDNFGVAGIGIPEYEYLLAHEALPLDPDVIVVAVFVGNDLDLANLGSEARDRWLRPWFDRERVLLWLVPERLARMREERRHNAGNVARVQGESGAASAIDAQGGELAARFPWIADPLREEPTISLERFEALELERARQVCGLDDARFRPVERALDGLRELAGSRKLVLLVIPDEFQVEDELWRKIIASAPGLERDRGQRKLAEWCTASGTSELDLLPALRAVAPLDDGRRHVYHLRDTHFNARGNRIAGEELARYLRQLGI